MRKRLTEAMIEKLRPPAGGRLEIQDDASAGLTLRVTPNGAKSFVVRGRIKGRSQSLRITIGDARGMKLSDARRRAADVMREMLAGNDPREAIRLAKKAAAEAERLRFDQFVERFIEEYAKPKNANWRDTQTLFERHLTPQFKGMRLNEVRRSDIKDALSNVRKNASEHVANASLAAIRKMFNWAKQEEYLTVVPGFSGLGYDRVERVRFLDFEEVRMIWRAAEKLGQPFGPFFQFLLATGQRRGEVSAARWASIDFDKEKLWRLSPEETKAKREHLVPLTEMARDILKKLAHINDPDESEAVYCFTTTGSTPISGFGKAKQKLDSEIEKIRCEEAVARGDDPDKLEPMQKWRVHDLRRTAATHMEDALGFAPHIVGAVLNHSAKSYKGVTAIYTRGELIYQRRQALTAWARLINIIVGDPVIWSKAERLLRPETEMEAAQKDEFRRMIMADQQTWESYLQGLKNTGDDNSILRLAG
jgi:integrase